MSGPFGVNMTIVSGQNCSGEIAVAAATFLSMNYLTIHIVSTDNHVRPEFLSALKVFGNRKGFYYQTQPREYVESLTAAQHKVFPKDFFWLAMDKQGETAANKILEENGEVPAKRVYLSVHKLNLIEQLITHPPITLEEKLLMMWCESLYDSLIPWQNIIKNIQSDLS